MSPKPITLFRHILVSIIHVCEHNWPNPPIHGDPFMISFAANHLGRLSGKM